MAIMTKTEYLIAQMKLHELRQQRPRLLQTYAELEQQVKQLPDQEQQLRTLFTSLQKIKMAEIALHPDVANLEPLLNDSYLSDETLSFWHAQLAKELPQGRLRSELIYIFGALLEEWVQEKSQELPPDPAGRAAYEQFFTLHTRPSEEAPLDAALLDTLFTDRSFMDKDIAAWFQTLAQGFLENRITTSELGRALERLGKSPETTASIRKQAQGLARDSVMCKEMADALSILLTHVDEWDWPEEGVSGFPLWTMNRWRLFITYDLFTMCFLEILGQRLQNAFQSFLQQESAERNRQLNVLLQEPPPTDEQKKTRLQQALHLSRLANSDIWQNLILPTHLSHPEEAVSYGLKEVRYNSIVSWRARVRKDMQKASATLSGYEAERSVDGMRSALQFLNAEIRLLRAAFPDRPLYVLKLDLEAFYPTLPHNLLLNMLERYGFSQRYLAFFRKVLGVRIRHGEEQVRFQRGVPLYHSFSNVLGEMVLNLMDQHILKSAHVQIIRMVDDICILTPSEDDAVLAWQAAQEFCRATGLRLNQEKCGAVRIQGSELINRAFKKETLSSQQLPTSLPSWLLVKLQPDGEWQVDTEAFATYLEQARRQVLHYRSLLSQIEIYNLHVKHLIRATAMESDLGKAHRQSIERAVATFHQDFFSQGQGMIETLRKAIQERFFGQEATALTLPEAWFYWPITAGGCGLTQVIMLGSGYAETQKATPARRVPAHLPLNWQTASDDWGQFYSSLIWHVHLKETEATKRMEMLVTDFIQRSNEMGNTRQTTLGPYWRWILYIYGPQILEHLGSFRFLSTELVPLQIILQHYQHALSSDDELGNGDSDLGDIDEHPF